MVESLLCQGRNSGFNSHRGRQPEINKLEDKRECSVTANMADFRSVDEGSIPFAPIEKQSSNGNVV